MKRIHTIRLKGPWEYEWLDFSPVGGSEAPERTGRVQAPVSWQECFGSRSGCVRWSRRFQSPTNLDPDERVFLSLEGVAGIERVALNDLELQCFQPAQFDRRYDLTETLRPTNLVQIDTRHTDEDDPSRGGLWCPIVLEIWTGDAT